MRSFIFPLIEETRADLSSSMTKTSETSDSDSSSRLWEPSPVDASARQVLSLERSSQYKIPKYLIYDISLKRLEGSGNNAEVYEPQVGDIISLTDKIPYLAHGNGSEDCYNIALVVESFGKSSDNLRIQSPKPLIYEQNMSDDNKRETIYVVFLINLTTNNCIWEALHRNPQGGNIRIIETVLQTNSSVRILSLLTVGCVFVVSV